MSKLNEMVLSEQITVKLEDEDTVIYVAGKPFKQCKYLLISLPLQEACGEFESIDEIAEIYTKDNEGEKTFKISPEEEFWGHCSNLQAWIEYGYDTRLLKSDLSFPLLKELAKRDKRAKQILKDEIAYRLESGSESVILFLIEEGYLDYFTKDEFLELFNLIKSKILPKSHYLLVRNLYKHDKLLCLYLIQGLFQMACITTRTWDAARYATCDNTARYATWYATWDAAWNAARRVAWDAAWNAARRVAWYATWNDTRNASRKAYRLCMKAIKKELGELLEGEKCIK